MKKIFVVILIFTTVFVFAETEIGRITWEFRDYGDSWDRSIPLPPSFNGGFDYNEWDYDSLEYQWAATGRNHTDESGRKYKRVIIPWRVYY